MTFSLQSASLIPHLLCNRMKTSWGLCSSLKTSSRRQRRGGQAQQMKAQSERGEKNKRKGRGRRDEHARQKRNSASLQLKWKTKKLVTLVCDGYHKTSWEVSCCNKSMATNHHWFREKTSFRLKPFSPWPFISSPSPLFVAVVTVTVMLDSVYFMLLCKYRFFHIGCKLNIKQDWNPLKVA